MNIYIYLHTYTVHYTQCFNSCIECEKAFLSSKPETMWRGCTRNKHYGFQGLLAAALHGAEVHPWWLRYSDPSQHEGLPPVCRVFLKAMFLLLNQWIRWQLQNQKVKPLQDTIIWTSISKESWIQSVPWIHPLDCLGFYIFHRWRASWAVTCHGLTHLLAKMDRSMYFPRSTMYDIYIYISVPYSICIWYICHTPF